MLSAVSSIAMDPIDIERISRNFILGDSKEFNKLNRNSKDKIRWVVDKIPKEVVENAADPASMVLERKLYDVVYNNIQEKPTRRRMYTDDEVRAGAIRIMTSPSATYKSCGESHGVTESVLRRFVTDLRTVLEISPFLTLPAVVAKYGSQDDWKERVTAAAQSQTIAKPGLKPLFTQEEISIEAGKADLRNGSGNGLSRQTLTIPLKGLAQAKSTSTSISTLTAARLDNFKCSAGFVRNRLQGVGAVLLTGPTKEGVANGKFAKTSPISEKRLKAADPTRQSAFAIKTMQAERALMDEGILPRTGFVSSRVFQYDEKGMKPEADGKFQRTYSLFTKPTERNFHGKRAERQSMHVTLGFYECADGLQKIPPIVVHEGGDEDSIRADKLLGTFITPPHRV